jgi:glycosyltransferase involved in cell wall biosynthesis
MQALFDGWHLRPVKKGGGIARDTDDFFTVLAEEFEVKLISYNVTPERDRVSIAKQYRRKFVRLQSLIRNPIDVNLTTDIFWIPQIGTVWNSKAKIVFVRIHDLFPLTNPEFFTKWQKIYFNKFLKLLDSNAVVLVCNSKTTANQVKKLQFKNNPKIEIIYCTASTIEAQPCNNCRTCSALPNLPPSFDLMVGTIEPRKNYAFASKVYIDFDRKLVIVGRKGWKSINTEQILSENPNIIRFSDCCDGALATLYKKCENFVSTSLAEGFNLPVAEAILYKKNVILSDILIHREIYPNATLLDLKDPVVWQKVLKGMNKRSKIQIENQEIDFSFARFQSQVKKLLTSYSAK